MPLMPFSICATGTAFAAMFLFWDSSETGLANAPCCSLLSADVPEFQKDVRSLSRAVDDVDKSGIVIGCDVMNRKKDFPDDQGNKD